MKTLARIALVCTLLLAVVAGAYAQKDKDKDKYKPEKAPSRYHFAYRHLLTDGSENMTQNWEGSINWDNHPKRDELWVQRDGKSYLILDSKILESFDAAFKPLWDFNGQRDKYMDGYYGARGEQRGLQHSARAIDRQIEALQRQSDRTKSDEAKKEFAEQIKDLQKQKNDMAAQQKDADRKLEQETKKRNEFYDKREVIRRGVYLKTDKLIDDAFAKGIPREGTPG